ncbi:hypothetical protein J2X05_003603 [Cellvibrio fibrivorans]|uniref:Uncharacterized protein n=1 Tax=Cellvibrio fibrivorans TaxID=126350 RepID=A0ABU1V2J7_9GAMM|nr:hypothetical protein [Cellvibrio fibrivorans]
MIKTRVIELFGLFRGRADYKGAGCDASAPNKSGHAKLRKCTEFTPKGANNTTPTVSVHQKATDNGINQ